MKKVLKLKRQYKTILAIVIGILAHIAMEYIQARISTAIRLEATEVYLIRWQVLYFSTIIIQALSILYIIHNNK